MGVDYYARMAVGVLLEEGAMFKTEMVEVDPNCEHTIAEGEKFCPECGTPRKEPFQRECKVLLDTWKKLFGKEVERYLGPKDPWGQFDLGILMYEMDWESSGGLRFQKYEGNPQILLGIPVDTWDIKYDSGFDKVPLKDLQDLVALVRKELDSFGVLPDAEIHPYVWPDVC